MGLFGRRKGKPGEDTRREAWLEVARLLDADLHAAKRSFDDEVVITHGPWRITLDTYVQSTGNTVVIMTRVRAHFVGWRGLKVTVRRRNAVDHIFEALGFGSRPALSPAVLDRYVVKGKPPSRVPSLFSGTQLGEALLSVPSLRLEVRRPSRKIRKRYGEDAGEILCRTNGVVTDVARLAGMIRAVAETLEGLERISEARWAEVRDPKETP